MALLLYKMTLLILAWSPSTNAHADDFSIQQKIVKHINELLVKSTTKSLLTDEECQHRKSAGVDERACTYEFAPGALANIVTSAEQGLIAFQLITTDPEIDNHDIFSDAMYMYSVLIWENMARGKTFEDAKAFLDKLSASYRQDFKADMQMDGWRYTFADSCNGAFAQMIGVKITSGTEGEAFLSAFEDECADRAKRSRP